LRLAVISPFLDRQHGTERVILEQIQRLAERGDTEIHIYAQQLADLPGVFNYHPGKQQSGCIFWHKVPRLPGPHLFGYLWWFLANQIWRWRDAHYRGLVYDVVYSPGLNALDADVIAVHIVFHEFYRRIYGHLGLAGSAPGSWPRLIHRRLYYRLIMALERRVYRRPGLQLVAVSQLVAGHLERFFHRNDVCVIPNAVDTDRFNPQVRARSREAARAELQLPPDIFALLLVGNDWAKKGLEALLHCLAECRELPIRLLVVGNDDRQIFSPIIDRLNLQHHVRFHGPAKDIERFYGAADVYAGPSLEDSFALPPLEAMACGLPVITSVNNGGAQIITEAEDGFVLQDPRDIPALAGLIRRLYTDRAFCARIGDNAALTARKYSWECNAQETWNVLLSAERKKAGRLETA